MKERGVTPEKALIRTVALAATGVAIAETLLGHNPIVDITAFIALANVYGVPVTPMLQAIDGGLNKLLNSE